MLRELHTGPACAKDLPLLFLCQLTTPGCQDWFDLKSASEPLRSNNQTSSNGSADSDPAKHRGVSILVHWEEIWRKYS